MILLHIYYLPQAAAAVTTECLKLRIAVLVPVETYNKLELKEKPVYLAVIEERVWNGAGGSKLW